MKKAVVMELNDNEAIVMQPGGIFVSVASKPDWQVGDIVAVQDKKKLHRKIASIAASFFIVVFLGLAGYNLYFTQTALISMDINPSIEIGVNRFGKVVSINGYNDDGIKILEGTSLKNKSYRRALDEIFRAEAFQKYMEGNSNLVYSVTSMRNEEQQQILKDLKSLTPIKGPEVSYFKVDGKTVEKAHSHHITAGKYMKIMELKEEDPKTEVKQYTEKSISDICGQIEKHKGHKNGNSKKHNVREEKGNHGQGQNYKEPSKKSNNKHNRKKGSEHGH